VDIHGLTEISEFEEYDDNIIEKDVDDKKEGIALIILVTDHCIGR
jgi:hypothetical protein